MAVVQGNVMHNRIRKCIMKMEKGTDSGDVKKTATKYDNRLDMSEMEELGNGIKFDGKPRLCIL